ncbi:MAG: hypothetical protein WD398_09120 [Cyclobacteriaceae bacterium]
MMKNYLNLTLFIGLILSFSDCIEDENPMKTEMAFTFNEGMNGWEGGFADLPVDGLDTYELDVSVQQLPDETGSNDKAIKIEGRNMSDDLFMFLKRKVDGLKPLATYEVQFDIELASQYPEESMGIGGSPGGSVFLKAGASNIEPVPEEVEEASATYLRMNIDKGNQSQDGPDMLGLGTIGIEGEDFEYELIRRGNPNEPFIITTDETGSIWFVIGTDSGFEGKTTLYYREIKVILEER